MSDKLRVCIRLFEADYEKLQDVNRIHGNPGVNYIIRQIVHDYVMRLKDEERRQLDKIEKAQIGTILSPEELLS